MGVFIKTNDSARYYRPTPVVDAATDRADEIAVGSNGGSKGYIVDSGAQDTPMLLKVTNRELMEVSQGFTFLLGRFSNLWAGAGAVKLRFTDNNGRVIIREFLADKHLRDYTYKVELAVVDGAGHIATKELSVESLGFDQSTGKYRYNAVSNTDEITFGSDKQSTPLTDLSQVSVYLRGYFYGEDMKHIGYIGGGMEVESEGGLIPFYLRGFAGLEWELTTSLGTLDVLSGEFPEGVEYMPVSEKITATIPSYSHSLVLLRAGFIGITRLGDSEKTTDVIPVCQKSSISGSLSFSMNTVRIKTPKEKELKFVVFCNNGHAWEIQALPQWITMSSISGIGGKTLTMTVAQNNSGMARVGLITVYDMDANQTYDIPCVQLGVERFYAVENIVAGQKKTVTAYAANIVEHTFDMTVSYYNAESFTLYLRQIGFNIADFAAGTDGLATLNMKSGACAGRSFNITGCEYVVEQDRWRLTLDRLEDSSVGMLFPNISFPISEGDRFVLTDMLMPEVYILVAERRLLAKARVYYDQNSKLRYLYDLEIDSKWIKNEGVYLRPGRYMKIADADLVGGSAEYVLIDTVTVTHNESGIPVFKVTLREKLYLPE